MEQEYAHRLVEKQGQASFSLGLVKKQPVPDEQRRRRERQ